MGTQLETGLATNYERLSPTRHKQVLEYACWLRENDVELPARLRSMRPPAGTSAELPPGLDPDLERALLALCSDKRLLIEDYVTVLATGPGIPGHVFLQLIGTIPEESLRRMEQAIEEECERIDYDSW